MARHLRRTRARQLERLARSIAVLLFVVYVTLAWSSIDRLLLTAAAMIILAMGLSVWGAVKVWEDRP